MNRIIAFNERAAFLFQEVNELPLAFEVEV